MVGLESQEFVVVGATGAVGAEMLSILAEKGVGANCVTALSSARSAGERVPYGAVSLLCQEAEAWLPREGSIGLLAVGAETARALAPKLAGSGSLVIDNSSAFRADAKVPLVIPEVNGELLASVENRLVANPNCSTILLAMTLEPLRSRFGLKDVVVSTYQAASGAGHAAMRELEEQTRAVLSGTKASPQVFPEPCAFNVFPHESEMDLATGWNGEERKMISELKRIFDDEKLEVSPTCVRVPVMRAHSQSVCVTLASERTEAEVRSSLAGAAGLQFMDDRSSGVFPTPLRATGKDDVLVGRLRALPVGAERTDRWCLWLAGDQLRKGAALNAIQCAEKWLEMRP